MEEKEVSCIFGGSQLGYMEILSLVLSGILIADGGPLRCNEPGIYEIKRAH